MASIPEDVVGDDQQDRLRQPPGDTGETGREPTLEELAQKLSIPLEKVRQVMDIATGPVLRI